MPLSEEELRQRLTDLQSRDAVQCTQIAAFGVDLSQRRRLDLNFWTHDEASAKKLAEALARNAMPAGQALPPAGDPRRRWSVSCSLVASVDFITTRENVATFLLFADKYGCEYDGWGTAVEEAAGPGPAP